MLLHTYLYLYSANFNMLYSFQVQGSIQILAIFYIKILSIHSADSTEVPTLTAAKYLGCFAKQERYPLI